MTKNLTTYNNIGTACYCIQVNPSVKFINEYRFDDHEYYLTLLHHWLNGMRCEKIIMPSLMSALERKCHAFLLKCKAHNWVMVQLLRLNKLQCHVTNDNKLTMWQCFVNSDCITQLSHISTRLWSYLMGHPVYSYSGTMNVNGLPSWLSTLWHRATVDQYYRSL